jgi:pimeloyl-ACP methyl ester carboxylesterase
MSVFGGLVVLIVLSSGGMTRGQGAKKPAKAKSIEFKSFDGVTLSGTFYPAPNRTKDATVLLLHHFDLKKGGSSQDEGWGDLAIELNQKGYSVLTFDFRGFGDSKEVDPEFWKGHKHNNPTMIKVRMAKPPTTISHTNFTARYLPYLVNDIAAAKAYLDRQNDQKSCNTSSLIVIGAGEGATLGAMWMANETRRRKDKNPNPLLAAAPLLGEPESKDLAAGIFLSISPRLGTMLVGQNLQRWIVEVGRENKVPIAFVYGKDDAVSDNLARNLEKAIKGTGKSKDFPNTGREAIAKTKLSGHKLLDKELDTQKWILQKYLAPVMEARGSKEWVERKVEASGFWYTKGKSSIPFKLNKRPGEQAPSVDLSQFGFAS